jgi:chromosome segregation ATPase
MDQRLDKGEKRFKNIDQYIATRTISNGHNNKTLTQLQKTVTTVEDRLDQHDIQLNTLQTILTQLQKSLQTIQDLLKGITIGAIVGLILYFINTIR